MTQQPAALGEARETARAEASKLRGALSAVAGSRWLMAVLATFALAFGTHLAYAPTRLPPVTGLSITSIGLPTSLDWGVAGEQVEKAREAAEREDVVAKAGAIVSANTDRIPLINAVGFGAALVLLAVNIWVMTSRRRFTRG